MLLCGRFLFALLPQVPNRYARLSAMYRSIIINERIQIFNTSFYIIRCS